MAKSKQTEDIIPEMKENTASETQKEHQAETILPLDYIAAIEDIRAIAHGGNDKRRMLTWREAVRVWETKQGREDARARAAFFVHIDIATTGECMLLDGMEDEV